MFNTTPPPIRAELGIKGRSSKLLKLFHTVGFKDGDGYTRSGTVVALTPKAAEPRAPGASSAEFPTSPPTLLPPLAHNTALITYRRSALTTDWWVLI